MCQVTGYKRSFLSNIKINLEKPNLIFQNRFWFFLPGITNSRQQEQI